MKVLLLAAGRGTRISRYLSGNPKCTVEIGEGKKLIEYTIEMFNKKGITDIAMVLGYNEQAIRDVLKDYEVEYYYNPFFDVTNSIASAWFAKDFLNTDDDILIMNADVFMEEKLFDHVIACEDSPVMFADGSRKEEADYKFKYVNGILKKYGKELEGDDITGEYVGIGKFDGKFMKTFLVQLENMIKEQKHGVWWENVVYELSEKQPVRVEDIEGMFWAEVDYIEDYERIAKFRGFEMLLKLHEENS